jgi:ubiquinone/menaquinone biosynthesis C-methylase UbiE
MNVSEMEKNPAARVAHKQWVERVFDSVANQYGEKSCSFFNYFGKRLVEQVPLLPNQHVLDMATGKGAVLFPLAEKVGPSGRVTGIDISEQMLKETSIAIRKREMDWIDLRRMDAEQLDFPDNSFDAVFCGFGLFFFPSLPQAMFEFKRVLKPDGFLAVSTWGNDSQLDALINKEIDAICPTASLAMSSLWSGEGLQNALEMANFKNIRIIEETKRWIHDTSEDWWESLWAHGSRSKLEQLSPKQLSTLHEIVTNQAQAFDQGNGIPEELQVFYGIATKEVY